MLPPNVTFGDFKKNHPAERGIRKPIYVDGEHLADAIYRRHTESGDIVVLYEGEGADRIPPNIDTAVRAFLVENKGTIEAMLSP